MFMERLLPTVERESLLTERPLPTVERESSDEERVLPIVEREWSMEVWEWLSLPKLPVRLPVERLPRP